MNKWMKNGMTGLVLSMSAIATSSTVPIQSEPAQDENLTSVSIDALDLAGGSKLKDRMITVQNTELEVVHATLYV